MSLKAVAFMPFPKAPCIGQRTVAFHLLPLRGGLSGKGRFCQWKIAFSRRPGGCRCRHCCTRRIGNSDEANRRSDNVQHDRLAVCYGRFSAIKETIFSSKWECRGLGFQGPSCILLTKPSLHLSPIPAVWPRQSPGRSPLFGLDSPKKGAFWPLYR